MIRTFLSFNFSSGDMVLLYNSRLRFSPCKLKSRWLGPFRVVEAFPSRVVDVESEVGTNRFSDNGKRLKHYQGVIEEERAISTMYLKEP